MQIFSKLFVVCDEYRICFIRFINSFPNNKILDMTSLKALANDKINVPQMMVSVSDRIENIVGKGENAGYQHFLLFPQCFQKASFLGGRGGC